MLHAVKHRFYDSHPGLPHDPDTDQFEVTRPIHTDTAHILVVAIGAFFGTLARYEIGILLPDKKSGWPMATFIINLSGAFILGLLLQALANHGKDKGGRRVLRLLIGTGFCGAYTTYSSLATGTALLMRDNHLIVSLAYAGISVVGGIIAAALGIQVPTKHHKRKRAS
jgi:CrcB protein